MLSQLKEDLKAAMFAKDTLKKNILRLVIGEIQTIESLNGKISDERIHGIIKKIIASNEETLAAGGKFELEKENLILKAYLPSVWTYAQIEVFFLDKPDIIAQIKAADKDKVASGLAMKALKAAKATVDFSDVSTFTNHIRTESFLE